MAQSAHGVCCVSDPRRHRTGFEETKDFPIRTNDLIAGRYQVNLATKHQHMGVCMLCCCTLGLGSQERGLLTRNSKEIL